MKFHIFGSCAGTQPKPGRRHVSFALEHENRLYWFDAGESCSYTACMMGLDLLRVRSIFITHPHMDHVGGLGNLLWNIRKIGLARRQIPYDGIVDVYMPNMHTWEGLITLLRQTEGNFSLNYQMNVHRVKDGLLWNENGIMVEALHNSHMPMDEQEEYQSFSFRITAEGKRVIYSGDVGTYEDLTLFLKEGCDVLFIETGHHDSDVITGFLNERGFQVGTLCYIHNGRDVLRDPETVLKNAKVAFGENVIICEDGTTIEI